MPSAADLVRRQHAQRHRGAGIPRPLMEVPDAELIRTLVAHGQPEWSARLITRDPQLRLAALRFWVDVGDAGRGDHAARERVDYIRASWSALRRAELISDDPRRDAAHIVDPADLL